MKMVVFMWFMLIGVMSSFALSVNGVEITKNRIDRETRMMIPQESYHANVSDEKLKELEKKAAENLINKEILAQYARNEGLKLSEAELKAAADSIVKAYGGEKKFAYVLQQAKLSKNDFMMELEQEQLIQKLYDKKIRMEFTDADLKDYYEKNKYKFKEPEKIKLKMIYTRNNPEVKDGRTIAKKRAEEAMAKLKAGEEFGSVASIYSNDMTRIKGGEMGYMHRGQMQNASAENAAFELKKGEMSKIVETDIGCFIFFAEEKAGANQLPFEKVKESLKAELKQSREKKKMDLLLETLKKQAKIKR